MFGYNSEEEVLKLNVIDLIDYNEREKIKEFIKLRYTNGNLPDHYETRGLRRDGSSFVMEVTVSIFDYNGENATLVILRDLSERVKYENEIKKSLEIKSNLLGELFHRTKNNMQVICGLLDLQLVKIKDKDIKYKIKNIKNKIASMSLVHEMLYQNQDLSKINFREYIENLINRLDFQKDNNIRINLKLDNIEIIMDIAIPCGMVFVELISNSLKYAFPEGWSKSKEIQIEIKTIENNYILINYYDNGVGLSERVDFSETYGLNIVSSIIKHQLDGEIDIKSDNGFKCQMKIRNDLYFDRINNEKI